jgi:exonuclease VII large subunit
MAAQVLFPDGAGRTVSPDGHEADVEINALCSAVRAPTPVDVPAIVL